MFIDKRKGKKSLNVIDRAYLQDASRS